MSDMTKAQLVDRVAELEAALAEAAAPAPEPKITEAEARLKLSKFDRMPRPMMVMARALHEMDEACRVELKPTDARADFIRALLSAQVALEACEPR